MDYLYFLGLYGNLGPTVPPMGPGPCAEREQIAEREMSAPYTTIPHHHMQKELPVLAR